MSEPTPETISNINRLRSSRMNAIGTLNTPRMSIQVNSAAEMSVRMNTKQLQMKLPITAVTEINALRFFQRRVNSVITAAEPSGSSKIIHGIRLLVVNFKTLRS